MTAIDIAVLREHRFRSLLDKGRSVLDKGICRCGYEIDFKVRKDELEQWIMHIMAVQSSLPEPPARPADAEGKVPIGTVISKWGKVVKYGPAYWLADDSNLTEAADAGMIEALYAGATPSPAVNQSVQPMRRVDLENGAVVYTDDNPLHGEYEDTIILANRILDRISADPDDDLAMLSRQFLRAIGRL